MEGFEWAPAPPVVVPTPGGDGWCVRDAVCEMFGWQPGSAEWGRFVESPSGADVPRPCAHLGLELFVVSVPVQWNELITKLDHPGIAIFAFPSVRISHAVYVHHVHALLHHWPAPGRVRNDLPFAGWPLGYGHLRYGPVLDTVIVDTRRPQGADIRPPVFAA